MMLTSLLIYCLAPGPTLEKTITLNTDMDLRISFEFMDLFTMMGDGRFAARTSHTVYIFDQEGRLSLEFGQKGDGPGEFRRVGDVIFTGSRFWVQDGYTINEIDGKGDFVRKFPSNGAIWLQETNGRVFGMPESHFYHEYKSLPKCLVEVDFKSSGDELAFDVDKMFHRLPEVSSRWNLNNDKQIITMQRDKILVVPQLESKIFYYSGHDMRPLGSRSIHLPLFADPPQEWHKRSATQQERKRFWRSWSRIVYFGTLGDGLLVAYGYPDHTDPDNYLYAAYKLDGNGEHISKKAFKHKGKVIGSQGHYFYLAKEEEDEEGFVKSQVLRYSW